jgi:hypothetical protein
MRIASFMNRTIRRTQTVLALTLAVLMPCFGQAQVDASAAAHLDSEISGFWELHPDSLNAPPPSLTPQALRMRGDVYKKDQYARRWCNAFGVPEIMYSYRPVDILVGSTQVVVPSEFVPLPRHIYIDRKVHNTPDILDPNAYGDSLGHWEGEDLIVETTGFSDSGIRQLPGGAFRTSKSILVERFHPTNGGKNLMVTSTWYDATVFTKPFTYSIYYYRLDHQSGTQPYSAGELTCNPATDDREHMLAEPKPVSSSAAEALSRPSGAKK